MPSKEQRLQVALSHLIGNLPYRERDELPDFVGKMPPEGVEWWLTWAQGAIERRRAQNALINKLQQKAVLQRFSTKALEKFLGQFSAEGIDEWSQDIEADHFPLAVIQRQNEDLQLESAHTPTEVFHDLFREIRWVNKHVAPALHTMEGIGPLLYNLATVAHEQCLLDDVGIYKGQLYIPKNGKYVPQQTELFCPFDYTGVYSGLMLTDYHESFGVAAFHSSPRRESQLPARTQFSIVTMQDPELRNMQQLRMLFYDENNMPGTSESCSTIVGDLTTLEDGFLTNEESFVLKQNIQKNLFYREAR